MNALLMIRHTACSFGFLFVLTALGARTARAAEPAANDRGTPATTASATDASDGTALFHTRPTFNAAGVGLYPLAIPFEVRSLSARPYVALGGTANVIRTRTTGDLDAGAKVVGVVAQARLAVGAEFRPARSFAFSAELAYAPWSLGRVVLPSATQAATTNVVDLSFGVEWR